LFDIIIKNGTVIDGSGNQRFKADIGVKKDRIVKIGNIQEKARRTIDASNLIVAPGFIDIHSHSEFTLLANPLAESKVRQGVTTEVVGNCGISSAPLIGEALELAKRSAQKYGIKISWSTFREYFSLLERRGVAVNVASLVGHGTLRCAVAGFKEKICAKDLERMKMLLEKSMIEGAIGMSSGLFYAPGYYATTEELIELCTVVAKYGGIYSTHLRNEGNMIIQSVKEAIKIGRHARVPVQISHLKVCGVKNWGNIQRVLKIIEKVRKEGINITFDVYPYNATSTELTALLPPWIYKGGHSEFSKRIQNQRIRSQLKEEMINPSLNWESMTSQTGFERIVISDCPKHRNFEGKNIYEISDICKKDPFEVIFDLLIEDESISIIAFEISEEDMQQILIHPLSMVGSDGRALSKKGFLGEAKPHPRNYGAFPRVLGRYVREKGLLTLELAVKKMSFMPAAKIGIRGRGLLKEGNYADIVIFDAKKIIDTATYHNPHQYPLGIEYVMVNGELVICDGEHTEMLPGRTLLLGK